MKREAQEELRTAYGRLFRRSSNIRETLPQLATTLKTPEGRELIEFLSVDSRRGYCSMDRERRLEELA